MRPAPSSTARAVLISLLAAAFVLPPAGTEAAPLTAATGPKGHPTTKKKPKHKQPRHGDKPAVKTVAHKKAPPPPPLDGTSYDYDYDGRDIGHPERRWLGRAFVHRKAAALSGQALPVLV